MDNQPHYQNRAHEPAPKYHVHENPDGSVNVCWTDGVGHHGERVYRWVSDLGPKRVSGDGTPLPGELADVVRYVRTPAASR